MSQPRTPPDVAIRTMPSRLTNEKVMLPPQMASKQLQQPVKKAVIVKNQTSHKSSSPIAPEAPVLPRPSVPVPYRRSVSSCPPNDEHKPLIEAATARQRPNVISIKKMASIKAYRTAEPRSTDAQQPVLLQGQSPINSLIMGEERWIYNIVNQTNEGLLTPCSPESQVAFMPQIPTPPTPPRHSQDKFANMYDNSRTLWLQCC